MATGLKVADYIGIAWACAADIPAYTVIYVHELNLWGRCLDRGGAIVKDGDLYWFDHLNEFPQVAWSTEITVSLYNPKD